jgi:diguanylate cyclase (GGDEF)-like protein
MKTSSTRQELSSRDVPLHTYLSIVDSLYTDIRSFWVGVINSMVAIGFTAWHSQSIWIFLCGAAFLIVAGARAIHMASYRRQRDTISTYRAARKWERAYVTGASAYIALIGIWCFIAFVSTDDSITQMLSLAVVLAQTIGVAGRNFGSPRLVNAQIASLGVPMVAGLLIDANIGHWVLAAFAAPYFLSVKTIAARLRVILLDAVIASNDNRMLAERFDTALNNMPHGLAMFDSNGLLSVCNRRWVEFMPGGSIVSRHGMSVAEAFTPAIMGGTVETESERDALRAIVIWTKSGAEGRTEVRTRDHVLIFTVEPMPHGGSIVVVEDVSEQRQAEAQLSHMARHDSLTGLPNRSLLEERLDSAIAMSGAHDRLALLFIDLDDLKSVNDTLGHAAGDALVQAAALKIRSVIQDNDVLARFGGNEFVVLRSPCRGPEEAAALAASIQKAVGEIETVLGHRVASTASIGIGVSAAGQATVAGVLKNADMALYRVKSEARGTYRFFEEEMDQKAQYRRSLELDLREAIRNEALLVNYQPLFNLRQLKITTCEALVRWRHPTRGPISPAEFIPIAEETGLIIELGRQVLTKACHACAGWPDGTKVAVNLSPLQIQRGGFIDTVRLALAESGLAAGRLEVEITESALMQDREGTLEVLRALRAMGVRVALDDFGTGYSSLSYLATLPLDKVKIDRSFLFGIESDKRALSLFNGAARLSADLGLDVVVEGVETHDQMRLCDQTGAVTEIQGFLLAPALPNEQVSALMDKPGASLLAAA